MKWRELYLKNAENAFAVEIIRILEKQDRDREFHQDEVTQKLKSLITGVKRLAIGHSPFNDDNGPPDV